MPEALRQSLWQADQLATPTQAGQPSGHATLDAQLPGGGWPPGALTELLSTAPGQGELRLLAPLLARMSHSGRPLVWINPPHRPHGPALQAWGIELASLLWVSTPQPHDAPWAAEQALAAGAAIVLCWSGESPQTRHPLSPPGRPQGEVRSAQHEGTWVSAALRRLHLAAQGGNSLLFMLRPLTAAAQSSPAALRVHCSPCADTPTHLAVHLLKRRGPAQAQPLRLDTRAWLASPLLQGLDKARPRPLVPLPQPLVATPDASPLAVPAPA